jgi:flavin-dependent dehydrogenase
VLGIEQREKGWRLRTRNGTAEADFLVVATGARNPLREVGTQWGTGDTITALGYFVPGARERIDLQFLKNFEGYIWVFPRCGHLSVGIGGKGEPAHAMRARLETYMDQQSISRKDAVFYSHMLPALDTPSWSRNRVSGHGWLAVGDAAGLVDPITGEGLYYAIRSGDLASQMVLSEAHDVTGKAMAYREVLTREFAHDLEYAAALARRVFLGRYLFRSIPERMVHFTRYSPRFQGVMQDLFAGTQPYLGLRERLLRNLRSTLQEVIIGFVLERIPYRAVGA